MLYEVSHQVLVVEDDDGIAIPLVRTLEREGYTVERTAEGLPAVTRATSGDIDLVVLDLGLPDIDGLEVCRRMRAGGYDNGIMILTARGGELDRVVGLDVGADDYIAKPFALSEFLARTRALLRRTGNHDSARGDPVAGANHGNTGAGGAHVAATPDALRIDTRSRRVWVEQTEVGLTTKEFDVLALLCRDRGTVVTREQLMDEVWDTNWYGSTKTLDVTVGRLRQKLEEFSSPSQVVTVRGVGFRMEDGPADA